MIPNAARRAPHQATQQNPPFHHAPNAALLIDFDNVTMGIRSDLGKELKTLLNSDVIRGKVAVQRAYADWRRYPQYIVPLAESSIDLIFAPAYGSAKKNATDLRMAIDAIELVFTRPEIGTFILMTGDSDFSSCVLKLKEYGKYVIGVGMRESSSDLLIQNCDEYYSYHALSGLQRTDEVTESREDPWVLLKRAAQQMIAENDVMRTDRLKQVMLDIDPGFDEKKIGYSKFSRFVQEGASKGFIHLRKMDNGQFEIQVEGAGASASASAGEATRVEGGNGRGRGRGRGRERDRERVARPSEVAAEAGEPAAQAAAAEATPAPAEREIPAAAPAAPAARTEPEAPAAAPAAAEPAAAGPVDDLHAAYGLLQAALRELGGDGKPVRDGDVKRKMLDLAPGFDESALGFPKFTRFLRQAHDAEAIDLNRVGAGNYEVKLGGSSRRFAAPVPGMAAGTPAGRRGRGAAPRREEEGREAAAAPTPTAAAPAAAPAAPAGTAASGREEGAGTSTPPRPSTPAPGAPPAAASAPLAGVGIRGRRSGRGAPAGPPPLLPGQVVQVARAAVPPAGEEKAAEATAAPAAPAAEQAAAEGVAPAKKGRRSRGGRKRGGQAAAETEAQAAAPAFSAAALGLPQGESAITQYLSTSYKGIGKKTAESLLGAFGDDLFRVMQEEPQRVRETLGDRRAETLLEQWSRDFSVRADELPAPTPAAVPAQEPVAAEVAPEAGAAPEAEAEARPEEAARKSRRGRGGRKAAAASTSAAETATATKPVTKTAARGATKATTKGARGAAKKGGRAAARSAMEPAAPAAPAEQPATGAARKGRGRGAAKKVAAPAAEAAPAVEEKPKSRSRRGGRGRGGRKKADTPAS
jgi:uncharacterized protein (TIGR00288 family)